VLFVGIDGPAIATIREVRWPRDEGRLRIPEHYERDPRWFGRSYREKLAGFVAAARGTNPTKPT